MFFSLIPILLITLSTIGLSFITKKSFSEILAPVLFSVILILYGFYVTDLLYLGRNIVFALLLILCAVSVLYPIIYKAYRSHLYSIVTSPAFAIYWVAVAVFFLFAFNKFVSLMDCLRLWGAYPKILHSIGTFQMGPDSHLYIYMRSYPPGMPLLCYFFTSFSNTFSEPVLFITYSYFCFSLILPFCKNLTWGNKKSLVIAFVSFIIAPWMITCITSDQGQFYSSLYIDIPLGICCGYFLYRSFHMAKYSLFDSICTVLSCGALALLKDSGAFFSLCGIFGCLTCGFIRRKDLPLRRTILCCITSALVLGTVYGIWRILLDQYGFTGSGKVNLSTFSLLTLVRVGLYFIRTPVTGFYSITGAVVFALPAILILIFSVKYILVKHNKNESIFEEYADLICQFICYALFFFGYCSTFIYDIGFQSYPSYIRYVGTLVASAFYILASDCFFRHHIMLCDIKNELKYLMDRYTLLSSLTRCTFSIVQVFVILAVVFSTANILLDFPKKDNVIRTQADVAVCSLTDRVSDVPSDIYLCIPSSEDDYNLLHHQIYFELLDDGFYVKNYFPNAVITNPEYDYTCKSFMDMLLENDYEYVMLTGVDQPMLDQFGELFSDATLESTNLIYRVDKTNYQLIPVE